MSETFPVRPGMRVLVHQMRATRASLAGMAPKVETETLEFTGTIAHIYGDHPTNPTVTWLMVRPDEPDDPLYDSHAAMCPKHGQREVRVEPHQVRAVEMPPDGPPAG